MSRRGLLFLAAIAVMVVAGACVAIGTIVVRGVSARDEPTLVETLIARRLRHLAIPARDRDLASPMPSSPEGVREGMEHFADHCAICHANDGSGNTPIGGGLYPKAPDMRLPATQDLSDGELFWIIRNGVRLSGMPAWGDGSPSEDNDSWALVQFIRHLPSITSPALAEMEKMNPRTPREYEDEKKYEQFLSGGEPTGPPPHH